MQLNKSFLAIGNGQTDGRTDGQMELRTFAILQSLSRLKSNQKTAT